NVTAQAAVARAHHTIGMVHFGAGDFVRAVDSTGTARGLLEAILTRRPGDKSAVELMASVETQLGHEHKPLAEDRALAEAERAAHLRKARDFYAGSLGRQEGLRAKGALSASDQAETQKIVQLLAACDAALAK